MNRTVPSRSIALTRSVLAIAWWGLLLVVVVIVVAALGNLATGGAFDAHLTMTVPLEFTRPAARLESPLAGDVYLGDALGRLSFAQAGPALHWLLVGVVLATSGPTFVVLTLLRKLIRSVGRGEVFTSANVRRVRGVAWVTILGSSLQALVGFGAASFLAVNVSGDAVAIHARFDVPFTGLLVGAVLLVVAQVFGEGVVLREEVEHTV